MYAPQATRRRPMGAVSPNRPVGQPTQTVTGKPDHLRIHRRALVQQQQRQRIAEMRREALIKLSVNGILIAVSVAALAKLIPAHLTQQNQLRKIESELAATEARVDILRSDFHRSFDPTQAQALKQQQSYRIDPDQRQVVWLTPGTSSGIQPPMD